MKEDRIKSIALNLLKAAEEIKKQCHEILSMYVSDSVGQCELIELESEKPVTDETRELWVWALKNGWKAQDLHDVVSVMFRGKLPQDLNRKEYESLAREIKRVKK